MDYYENWDEKSISVLREKMISRLSRKQLKDHKASTMVAIHIPVKKEDIFGGPPDFVERAAKVSSLYPITPTFGFRIKCFIPLN